MPDRMTMPQGLVAMSNTESRWIGTCEVCGGDVVQLWVTTPAIGNSSPIEQPRGPGACSTDPQHDWRGVGTR